MVAFTELVVRVLRPCFLAAYNYYVLRYNSPDIIMIIISEDNLRTSFRDGNGGYTRITSVRSRIVGTITRNRVDPIFVVTL